MRYVKLESIARLQGHLFVDANIAPPAVARPCVAPSHAVFGDAAQERA